MALLSFLDKERSVAGPGYSRWLVPPAALAIHLSIGQVYAWSVFKEPLSTLIGGHASHAAGDWTQEQVGWIFSIAIGVLGVSAALFGKWLERNGPRKAMFVAACCFGAGFAVAALGVYWHQLWLVILGYGGIGGIGLGLGYLAPVGNLVKWFNDRPGLATGMAIMGFGGGAMIGSPLATTLMGHFRAAGASANGVPEAMLVMGALYFAFMLFGTFVVRVPPPGWNPGGKTQSDGHGGTVPKQPGGPNVDLAAATRSPQFWLLWLVLCLNTTAGISIIETAAPLIRELFGKDRIAEATAGEFVGLLSLFNMGGRFFWSSLSDYVGRKVTFALFFLIGAAGYSAITSTEARHLNSIVLFVGLTGVLISIYGGGFATMPAYVRDLFGTKDLNAIYGRILTAWSVAGIVGPALVGRMRKSQIDRGVLPADAYSRIFYVMAGLLVVGLICDLLIRPVSAAASEVGGPIAGQTPTPGSAVPPRGASASAPRP